MENLKTELDFIELEDRLEMVNLAEVVSSAAPCHNSKC